MANDFGEDGKEQNINTGREKIDYIEAGLEAQRNWESHNVEALFSEAHMVELWNSPREEALGAILDELGLVALLPGVDFDPSNVASYIYIWVNWDNLRKGKHPFLYIGSRRFNGDPMEDTYKGTNITLNRDQDSGHDLEKYILAVFSDDGEEGVFRGHAYMLEDQILKAINVRRYTDFYNISKDGAGWTSESARVMNLERWSDPKYRENHSAAITSLHADPNSVYNSPECREKQSAIKTAQRADPNSKYNSPEFPKKQSHKRRMLYAYLHLLGDTPSSFEGSDDRGWVRVSIKNGILKSLEERITREGLLLPDVPLDHGPKYRIGEECLDRIEWIKSKAQSIGQMHNRLDFAIFEQNNPKGRIAQLNRFIEESGEVPDGIEDSVLFFEKWGNRGYLQQYVQLRINDVFDHSARIAGALKSDPKPK